MTSLTIPTIPTNLNWKNQPLPENVETDIGLSITAGATTDWFIHPAGNPVKNDAPALLFYPPDENLLLAAKVTVGFEARFDAGCLFVYESDDLWAKLCFEYSPENIPTIVSVVTRGTSDDCNSVSIGGNEVYLRIYRHANILAFHYSKNGNYWHLVRHFTMGSLKNPQFGFSAQSPTGQGCTVSFSEISFQLGRLTDIRNGT
jgi:regulation of enolase protein 1 (concanavalin A-like superfamily)